MTKGNSRKKGLRGLRVLEVDKGADRAHLNYTKEVREQLEVGQSSEVLRPIPGDVLPLARLHFQHVIQSPQTAPLTEEQAFKHSGPWGTFRIQVTALGLL